jgi:glycosyltransferase involved in cell wall biosynthesis
MRVLFALPGFHKVDRGAEVALIAIATELAHAGHTVTLIGSGQERPGTPYRFLHTRSIPREKFRSFPTMPFLRNDCAYEELTSIPHLLRQYRPQDYDVTLTCSYPFTNWILRRPTLRGARPRHIFVTENGDWPAYSDHAEYRFFGCDGLVCTNPIFLARNQARWRCQLIPNGIDPHRFKPGTGNREMFGLPANRLIVLMVSALIPSKRVELGIEMVSRVPEAQLVVAGDGPLRDTVDATAARLLPGRFTRLTASPGQMPLLYQCADVFLHLSKEEAFGNVFLEAMACGLPVVAHDSIATRWILGDDQFLIDTEDRALIVNAITGAVHADSKRREAWLDRAVSFSLASVGRMYDAFLREVVSEKQNAAVSRTALKSAQNDS